MKNKRLYKLALLSILFSFIFAQIVILFRYPVLAEGSSYEYNSPSLVFDTTGTNKLFPWSSVMDVDDNQYILGNYVGIGQDVDPSVGGEELTPTANGDFLMKLDSSRNHLWTKFWDNGTLRYVDVDANGNPYVGGYFKGNMDVDPSATVDTRSSHGALYNDSVIIKLDTSGNFVWANTWGEGTSDVKAYSMSVGSSCVYSSGTFSKDTDFDPSGGVSTVTATGGVGETFVSKFNLDGDYLWTKAIKSAGGYADFALTQPLSNDDVIVYGEFDDIVDLNPGVGQALTSQATGSGIYVTRWDSNGNYVWSQETLSDNYISPYSTHTLKIGSSDNVFVAGYFDYEAYLDPDSPTTLYEADNTNVFLQKYDSNGNFAWVKHFEGSNYGYPEGLSTNSEGEVFVSIYFGSSSNLDLDPGTGVSSITALGTDAGLVGLDGDGDYLWGYHLKPAVSDYVFVSDILFDSTGDMRFVGSYDEIADLDPTEEEDLYETTGDDAMFISYYSVLGGVSGVSITGLSSELSIKDILTGNDATVESVDFISSSRNLELYYGSGVGAKILAKVNIDFSESRSWSGVSGGIGEDNSFVKGLSSAPGSNGSISLYVPKAPGDDHVFVCPGVTSLSGIGPTCVGGYSLDYSDSSTSIVFVGDDSYWLISGLTDAGAFSYVATVTDPEEEEEEDNTYYGSISNDDDVEEAEEITKEEEVEKEKIVTNIENKDVDIEVPEEKKESIFAKGRVYLSKVIENVIEVTQQVVDSEEILEGISTTAVVATAGIATANAILTGSTFVPSFMQFPSLIAMIAKPRKKSNRYGIVYDVKTKEPLSGAVVRVKNLEGKLVETYVSDIYGVIDMDLLEGQYALEINKKGFELVEGSFVEEPNSPYKDLYLGGIVKIENNESFNKAIPMRSIEESLSAQMGFDMRYKLFSILDKILIVLIVVGFVSALINVIKFSDMWAILLVVLYIIILVVKYGLMGILRKEYGQIVDKRGNALEGVEIGLKDMEFSKLVAQRITDSEGNYRFIVPGGSYELESLDSRYKIVSENKIKKGNDEEPIVINQDIVLEKVI